ncbi:hypothetical protein D3C81_1970020 [compost metagenome]
MFISAGASVPGVNWNSTSTPLRVMRCSGWLISSVGAIRLTVALAGTPLPSPASTWPRGPRGRGAPYMYWARRFMAGPASTFSPMACSKKPSGAMTWTLPAFTSASSITPRAPPKWSMCGWV